MKETLRVKIPEDVNIYSTNKILEWWINNDGLQQGFQSNYRIIHENDLQVFDGENFYDVYVEETDVETRTSRLVLRLIEK